MPVRCDRCDRGSGRSGWGRSEDEAAAVGSGVNGLLVGDWIKGHADEVISHNIKYEMQKAKDPSKTETYYNMRHGAEKITKILELVNEQFLDGEALKSQQAKE